MGGNTRDPSTYINRPSKLGDLLPPSNEGPRPKNIATAESLKKTLGKTKKKTED